MNFLTIYAAELPKSCGNYNLFDPEVKKFLEDSEEAAQNILGSTERHDEPKQVTHNQRPRVSVICYSLGHPYRFGNSYSLFNVNQYNYLPPSYNRGEKDQTARVLIGL